MTESGPKSENKPFLTRRAAHPSFSALDIVCLVYNVHGPPLVMVKLSLLLPPPPVHLDADRGADQQGTVRYGTVHTGPEPRRERESRKTLAQAAARLTRPIMIGQLPSCSSSPRLGEGRGPSEPPGRPSDVLHACLIDCHGVDSLASWLGVLSVRCIKIASHLDPLLGAVELGAVVQPILLWRVAPPPCTMYYAVRTMHAELALQQHPLVGPGPGTDPAGLAWDIGTVRSSHTYHQAHTPQTIFSQGRRLIWGLTYSICLRARSLIHSRAQSGQAIGRSNPRTTLKRGGLINKTLMPETVPCRPSYVVVGVGSAAGWWPQVRNHRHHCCCCRTTGRYTAHLTDVRVKLVWEREKNVLVSYFPKQPDASCQRESRFFCLAPVLVCLRSPPKANGIPPEAPIVSTLLDCSNISSHFGLLDALLVVQVQAGGGGPVRLSGVLLKLGRSLDKNAARVRDKWCRKPRVTVLRASTRRLLHPQALYFRCDVFFGV